MVELSIVLVQVEHPGNLGAIARVMKNFNVKELLLIDSKASPSDEEAKQRAVHAQDILTSARIVDFSALENFDLVIGTTAQLGNDFNLPRTPIFPSQLAEKLEGVEGKVALLFGSESDGLRNNEIERCDFLVTIPTSEEYRALNLSHAVAIILYTLLSSSNESPIEERFPLVKAAEKAQLKKMIDELLNSLDFSTEEKQETQELLWKRLIGKSMLTQREAMALMGFFRKLEKKL